jgi:hypothetical protein
MKDDTIDSGDSDQSSYDSDTSSRTGEGCTKASETEDSNEQIGETLSRLASKPVYQTRLLVLLILSITSIVVSLVVYYVCKRVESNQFDSQFNGAADKVLEAFASLPTRIGSISAVSIFATIQGMNGTTIKSKSWPFVTFPSFEYRAAIAIELSGTMTVAMHPLVSEDHRSEYETFSTMAGRYYMYVPRIFLIVASVYHSK